MSLKMMEHMLMIIYSGSNMLILSKSQSKNYFKKLQSSHYNEGCGCCFSSTHYEIKDNKILRLSSGEHIGYRFLNVSVVAKIKKARSN